MKRLQLIVGLSLGCMMSGCPSDDTGDEGAGTTEAATSDPGTTTAGPTTTEPGDTTEAPDDTTTTGPTTTTDPDDTTAGPGSTTDEPGTTGVPTLSFALDVYPIISANCSCHVNGSSGSLAMPDAATAYDNLIGVPSANMNNDQNRVEPGDPDQSYLLHKVNGTLGAGEGSQMPLNQAMLGAGDRATIEQWILEGAEP